MDAHLTKTSAVGRQLNTEWNVGITATTQSGTVITWSSQTVKHGDCSEWIHAIGQSVTGMLRVGLEAYRPRKSCSLDETTCVEAARWGKSSPVAGLHGQDT